MRLEDNRPFILLWLNDFTQLVIIKSEDLEWIYKRQKDDMGDYKDTLWLEDGYKDIKIIMKSNTGSEKKYCFVRLTDEAGTRSIMEVVNKEPVLEEYQPNHYKIVSVKQNTLYGSSETLDVIYRILNKRKNNYALYSLLKGFIFGPYKYEKIEKHRNGVILDEKIALENCGDVIDLTNYDYQGGGVYIRKDKKVYLLFLDQEESMFVPMEKDYSDDNVMIAETEHEIFKYDKTTGECKCHQLRNNQLEDDWSKYDDIVFEG